MTTIQKWGNSLAVRIPRDIAEELDLSEGKHVMIKHKDGMLTVRPVQIPSYSLKELLKGVTKMNLHKEIDWGPPRGKEIW